MSVADLANTPTTKQELLIYSALHMGHHREINSAIYRKYGIVLPLYAIDPTTPNDPAWGYLHQVMHNNNDALLGVSSYDLIEVNWGNPGQLSSWIWLNFQLHYQEAFQANAW